MECRPTVMTEGGLVAGRVCSSSKGVKFYSFQGIPYAKPPVGKLRFKAPQPALPWKGILDATKEAPHCYQRHIFRYDEVGGTEDCLYLNVYTPELRFECGPYPVMVWIHGGGFVSGSSKTELCGPDHLMSQTIVLVTFNYRVGMLGFMSLEDERIQVPGNAGLKDQVLALKWVRKNIIKFRGNRHNVTLFGQSSGAACVHLHMLSPMSKDLFHKAIMQSGCALNPWVNGVFGSGRLLADYLGFKGNDEKIFRKVKELPVEKIFEAQEHITNDNMVNIKWFCSPVIERQRNSPKFLADEPIRIIRSGNYNKVPMIIGYTNREGMYWDLHNRMITGKPEIIIDFKSAIPCNLKATAGNLICQTMADRIRAFYWGPRLQSTRMGRDPRLKQMDPLYQLLTDVFFLRGIHSTVKNHYDISPETPIYFYRFSYETKLNVFKQMLPHVVERKYPGAMHGDDLNYLFTTYLTPNISFGDIEDVAINKMTKLWTVFAETGDPTSAYMRYAAGEHWPPIFHNCFQYAELCEEFHYGVFPDDDRMRFWDTIYKNDKRTQYL